MDRMLENYPLKDFEVLHLKSVDEMVASYGSALKVLSENWPVVDGDEPVSPIRAMREASTVVAQYQMDQAHRRTPERGRCQRGGRDCADAVRHQRDGRLCL